MIIQPRLRPPAQGKDRSRRIRASAVNGEEQVKGVLLVGAILPQLLESTVLQDVDVTNLQPGLGRDLVGGPTLHIPAVDDVRPALVELRPCLPHHFAPGFQLQPAAPIFA
jgi:hypothetical protein